MRTVNIISAILLFVSTSIFAQEESIRKLLTERIPDLPKIESIKPAPVPGLYEVLINRNQILYVDEKVQFIIDGQIVSIDTKENVTQRRITEFSAIPFDQLPFKDSYQIKRGQGSRKLAIFVDPNCSYCRRLEDELKELDNVTLSVFLYPILGSESKRIASDTWCAKDRAAAYSDYLKSGKQPAKGSCDTSAIDRNIAFGKKMRIMGTPAIILSDGTMLPGMLNAKALEERLVKVVALKR